MITIQTTVTIVVATTLLANGVSETDKGDVFVKKPRLVLLLANFNEPGKDLVAATLAGICLRANAAF